MEVLDSVGTGVLLVIDLGNTHACLHFSGGLNWASWWVQCLKEQEVWELTGSPEKVVG